MRNFFLKIPYQILGVFMVGLTILLAFLVAFFLGLFFDTHQLVENTELISSVYQVLGTVYAVLITFTLWGVWQKYADANSATQNEAYALLDLVHAIESTDLDDGSVRKTALAYANHVLEEEWHTNRDNSHSMMNLCEPTHPTSIVLMRIIQAITPTNNKENVIFGKTISLFNSWLDARRTRLLLSRGNSAKALWPLLLTGAFILFGFHGLFVAKTMALWAILLLGFSCVIGLSFYLIFALDCPFGKYLGIDAEPFKLVVNILSSQKAKGG